MNKIIKETIKDIENRIDNFYKLVKKEPLLFIGLTKNKITIKDAIKGEYKL